MSDLISREALLKELSRIGNKHMLLTYIHNLIANAPAIEQGEAVTKLWESLGRWSAYLASNGEQAELSPPSWLTDAVMNATTSQQPQSVADALEEAIKIAVSYCQDGMHPDDLERDLRALIKRNADVRGRFSEYETNVLTSLSNWLETRSDAIYFRTYSGLMKSYAKDIKFMLTSSPNEGGV
jgi:hypothetical protein